MDAPYLPADEYPHSRWEEFINDGKNSFTALSRYICGRYEHLNLTVLSIYKIDQEETIWREAPYIGYSPPAMYNRINHVCARDTALNWTYNKDNCTETDECPWSPIETTVRNAFKEAYPAEKTMAPREQETRTKLIEAAERKERV